MREEQRSPSEMSSKRENCVEELRKGVCSQMFSPPFPCNQLHPKPSSALAPDPGKLWGWGEAIATALP